MDIGSSDSSSSDQSSGGGFTSSGDVSGGVNIGQGSNVGMSTGTNESFNNQLSQSGQNVWGAQAPYLSDIYNQSSNLMRTTNQGLYDEGRNALGMTGDVQNQALPEYQNQLQGGVYNPDGIGQDYRALTRDITGGGMGQYDTNFNQYLGDMNTSLMANADDTRNAALSSLDARAAASGMSGGSRHGQAQGRALGEIDQNLQSNMANVAYNAFESDQNRQQAAFEADRARRMQGSEQYGDTIAQQQAAQQQALGQANDMTQLANAGFNPYNNIWSNLGNYAGLVGGPTSLANSLSQGQSGSFGSTFGANMGNNQNLGFNFGLGQNYGNTFNQSTGESDSDEFNASILS